MSTADPQAKVRPRARARLAVTARLPKVLRIFWAASAAAFALMLLLRSIEQRAGFAPSFYNFLGPRFTDLLEYIPSFRLLHTAPFYRNPITPSVAYPPVGAVLFALLYSSHEPVAVYFSIVSVALAIAIWRVRCALLAESIDPWTATLFPLTLVLVSFPIFGLLESGNLELFVWIFSAAGICLFLRGHDDAAAVLWALAAATKLYPVIFLALLIPRRSYRALAVGIALFVTASVLSMWFMGPSISLAWHGSVRNVFGYQGIRVSEWSLHELAANHSAFSLAKLAATVVGFPLTKLTLPYYALGALIFAAAFFGRLRKMPVANQLLAVSAFMVMLPAVSYFYTLAHLYAPWLLLVFLAIRADRVGVRVPGLRTTILLCLPLFVSFTLFTFPQVLLFGGLIQAFVLAALFICALCFPFAEPRTGRIRESSLRNLPVMQEVAKKKSLTFQELLFTLQKFWAEHGCVLQQPYDLEVGAGTMSPDTFLRVLGPKPIRIAYAQPSRRPADGRYGENPNRLFRHTQLQVILKPPPERVQELYLESLVAIGIDLREHDIKFEEDNWEWPVGGAWGVGWQVMLDGQEITQFTYFQQCGGMDLDPISGEITYGLERIAQFLQDVDSIYDIVWARDPGTGAELTYGDVRLHEEQQFSAYSFDYADVEKLWEHLRLYEAECLALLGRSKPILGAEHPDPLTATRFPTLGAYELALKCSHTFNLLDARGAISVTERVGVMARIRNLIVGVAKVYAEQQRLTAAPE